MHSKNFYHRFFIIAFHSMPHTRHISQKPKEKYRETAARMPKITKNVNVCAEGWLLMGGDGIKLCKFFQFLSSAASNCQLMSRDKGMENQKFSDKWRKANEGWQGEENQVKIKGKNFHFSRHSKEMLIMSTRDISQGRLRTVFNLHFGSRRCCQPRFSLRKMKGKISFIGWQWDNFRISTLTSSCRRLCSLAIVDNRVFSFNYAETQHQHQHSAYVHIERMVKCKWNADPAASHYNFLFHLLNAELTLICYECYFLIRTTAASHWRIILNFRDLHEMCSQESHSKQLKYTLILLWTHSSSFLGSWTPSGSQDRFPMFGELLVSCNKIFRYN